MLSGIEHFTEEKKMSVWINEQFIKTNCAGEPEVVIGNSFFSMQQFCDIVRYVMTNTDLKTLDDPRQRLRGDFRRLEIAEGFNKGGLRLSFETN